MDISDDRVKTPDTKKERVEEKNIESQSNVNNYTDVADDDDSDIEDMDILKECAETVVALTRSVEEKLENEKIQAELAKSNTSGEPESANDNSNNEDSESDKSKGGSVMETASESDKSEDGKTDADKVLAAWNEIFNSAEAEVLLDIIKEKIAKNNDSHSNEEESKQKDTVERADSLNKCTDTETDNEDDHQSNSGQSETKELSLKGVAAASKTMETSVTQHVSERRESDKAVDSDGRIKDSIGIQTEQRRDSSSNTSGSIVTEKNDKAPIVIDLESMDTSNRSLQSQKTPVKQIARRTNVSTPPSTGNKSGGRTPTSSRKSKTHTGKGSFIDKLILKGVPIIIPDEDEEEQPIARNSTFRPNASQYNQNMARPNLQQQSHFPQHSRSPSVYQARAPQHVLHSPGQPLQPRQLFTPPKNFVYPPQVSPSRGRPPLHSGQTNNSPLNPTNTYPNQKQQMINNSHNPTNTYPIQKQPMVNSPHSARPQQFQLSPMAKQSPRSPLVQQTQPMFQSHLPGRGPTVERHRLQLISPAVQHQLTKKLLNPHQMLTNNPSRTIVIEDEPISQKYPVQVPHQTSTPPFPITSVISQVPNSPSLPIISNVTSMAREFMEANPFPETNPLTLTFGSLLPECDVMSSKPNNDQSTDNAFMAQVKQVFSIKRSYSEELSGEDQTQEQESKRRNTSEEEPTVNTVQVDTSTDNMSTVQESSTGNKLVPNFVVKTEVVSPTKQAPGVEIDIDVPAMTPLPTMDIPSIEADIKPPPNLPTNINTKAKKLKNLDLDSFSPPISPSTRRLHSHANTRSRKLLMEEPNTVPEPESTNNTEKLEKSFGCGDCGKTFGTKHGLTLHFKTHTKDVPFECDVCGKHYSKKGCLMKHIHTHFQDST